MGFDFPPSWSLDFDQPQITPNLIDLVCLVNQLSVSDKVLKASENEAKAVFTACYESRYNKMRKTCGKRGMVLNIE